MTDTPIVFRSLVRAVAPSPRDLSVEGVGDVIRLADANLDAPEAKRFAEWLYDQLPTRDHRIEAAFAILDLGLSGIAGA